MNAITTITAEELASISTPDKVESRLGTLEFNDGAPSEATAALLYDNLDFVHGVQAFLGALPGASLACGAPRYSVDRDRGQLVLVLPGTDGLDVAVPDRELRHGLLLGVHRPVGRTDGDRRAVDRGAVGDPRHDRRHVVPVGHRRRSARSGPWRRAAAISWSGPATTGRCPTAASTFPRPHDDASTLIGRAFMVDNDPTVPAEAIRDGVRVLPVRTGCAWDRGRRVSSPARRRSVRPPPVPETRFVEARACRQHLLPERLRVLGARRRAGAAGAARARATRSCSACSPPSGSCTASRSSPTHGCARSSRRRSWSATPPPAPSTFAARPEEGFALLPGLGVGERALRRRLRVPRSAAADHRRRRRSRPRATVPASSTPAPTSSTWPPASHRRCACASPASARSTSTRCATARASTSTAPATTASRSRPTFPRAGSGR